VGVATCHGPADVDVIWLMARVKVTTFEVVMLSVVDEAIAVAVHA
jgi:hypothetical protein